MKKEKPLVPCNVRIREEDNELLNELCITHVKKSLLVRKIIHNYCNSIRESIEKNKEVSA